MADSLHSPPPAAPRATAGRPVRRRCTQRPSRAGELGLRASNRPALWRGLVAAVLAAGALTPDAAGAQSEPSPEEQLEDVRSRAEAVAAEIDVLEAESAEIEEALAAIQTEIAGQQVVVNAANDAWASAEAELAASEARIEELEGTIAELEVMADQLVVQAFTDPPINHALEAFNAETLTDATVMRAILDVQSKADADALEALDQARDELEEEKEVKEQLAAEAAEKKAEADAAMAELEAALAVQEQFATDVEARLNAKLAEAEALAAADAELSRQIAAEQAALAAALQASTAQPAAGSSTITPAPGGLATVSCPGGGSITVAGSIASNVQRLLNDAAAAGIRLCGGGYRDPQQQIELRKAHCGTSQYAIYEMPSSQCSPPTARPGTSMHEQGLAIDFTCNGGGTVSSGDSCFR